VQENTKFNLSINDRLFQFADYKNLSRYKLSKEIGVSEAILHNVFTKKNKASTDLIQKLLNKYEALSPLWLLTGKGEMLKVDGKVIGKVIGKVNKKPSDYTADKSMPLMAAEEEAAVYTKKGIPLIPIEAMAGWGNGDTTIMEYDAKYYNIPEFNELKVDFMINVKGSSMYPTYNSGDIVACKKLPLDTFFQWNKVYVLDTIQGAMIKRIKKSDQKSHIICFSDNKSYDPFDLALTQVHSLAIVVGVIRLE